MVCASEVTEDFSIHLAWVVEIYLKSFKELYGGSTLKNASLGTPSRTDYVVCVKYMLVHISNILSL